MVMIKWLITLGSIASKSVYYFIKLFEFWREKIGDAQHPASVKDFISFL